MPNLILEYSDSVEHRVNIQSLLEDLHHVALNSGLFERCSVKSRTLRSHNWLVGDVADSKDFIHIRFELLEGRTPEQKRELSQQFMDILVSQASHVYSLTVALQNMEKNSFMKVINH